MVKGHLRRVIALLVKYGWKCDKSVWSSPKSIATWLNCIHGNVLYRGKLSKVTEKDDGTTTKGDWTLGRERARKQTSIPVNKFGSIYPYWCICQPYETMNVCGPPMFPLILTLEKLIVRKGNFEMVNMKRLIGCKRYYRHAPWVFYMKSFLKHLFKEYFESIVHVLWCNMWVGH